MIVFDTETTGLLAPASAPIEQQPHIVEFAAVSLDDKTLKETTKMEFLCNPSIIMLPEVIKIHNITNEQVKDLPPFLYFFPRIVDFFLGQRKLLAHNLPFDVGLMKTELIRIDRLTAFPWPPDQLCTVQASLSITGARLHLQDLYREITGKERTDKAHRAMDDVRTLCECIRGMRKRGMI